MLRFFPCWLHLLLLLVVVLVLFRLALLLLLLLRKRFRRRSFLDDIVTDWLTIGRKVVEKYLLAFLLRQFVMRLAVAGGIVVVAVGLLGGCRRLLLILVLAMD